MDVENALSVVDIEIESACGKFHPFTNPHEGYAVLLEEVDELWAEIKNDKRPRHQRLEGIREEAMQVAAMAIRLMVDCT